MKIFFAGDFCSKSSASRISVSEDLKELIRSCEVRVINFEVPLRPEIELPKQNRQRYYQNDDVPDFLRGLGFNVFQLANNHAFDWDAPGFYKTKEALGDAALGAGTLDEAYKVKVVEADGLKIGFMALTFAAYKGVFDDVTKYGGLGCAYINDLRVNHIILETKKKVDYLFILAHDGIEYIDVPLPETIARYRDFIDYGADGVIGTHPHCPQGWETYKDRPIFYSLGNFFFNSKESPSYKADKPHWYEGLCVVVEIADGKMSWHHVNTRNNCNEGLVIDRDPVREESNAVLCNYLEDRAQYDACLERVCKEWGVKEVAVVDRTMHPQSLRACTRRVLEMWGDRIRGHSSYSDYPLQRLLAHDARRALLKWTIKNNK